MKEKRVIQITYADVIQAIANLVRCKPEEVKIDIGYESESDAWVSIDYPSRIGEADFKYLEEFMKLFLLKMERRVFKESTRDRD